MDKFKPYAKAIVGGLAAGLGALSVALDGGVSVAEWLNVALAALGGTGIVYAIPNRSTED